MEDDDDDNDDDGDVEDEDVDEVFGALLPPTPPSSARPATKKFKSAATVATAAVAAAGGKKKKKSPSIVKKKKIQQRLERARCSHDNGDCGPKESRSLAMNDSRLCTPPIRCPTSQVASAVRVVHSSERCSIDAKRSAIFIHGMRTCYTDKREDVFHVARHTRKESPTYQADLVDLSSLLNFNNSYRYLLTCIDVFTKRAWAILLRKKTGREVTAAFQKILATSDRNPRMLQTDKGMEFLNAMFQRMLAINGIHWYSTENEDIKASVVERFNRMLKIKMSRYFTYKNLPRYIDVLPRLVASYNASYHRSIGMSPNDVNASNEDHVRKRLFPRRTKRDERDGTSNWANASA